MTKEEFGKWVHENRNWLNYKAEHWCIKIGKSHFEKEEVVSSAVYTILNSENKRYLDINPDKIRDFMFICLRNATYNSIIQDKYYRNVCCEEGYQDWFFPSTERIEEDDKSMFKKHEVPKTVVSYGEKYDADLIMKKIEARAKSKNEKLVFSYFKAGYSITETQRETCLNQKTVGNIYRILLGKSRYKNKKRKPSENPNGRPKTNYPIDRVNLLKDKDKAPFIEFYVENKNRYDVMEKYNMTENDFRAFGMRVKRAK